MTAYEVAGRQVALPVQVRDASAGTAMLEVDAAAAQALLPTDAFEVVEVADGRAQLALIAVDYRDNDLGAYREIGIALFVQPAGGGEPGTFLLRLPVDQPFTCEAGREIWGFPKTLERIDLELSETSAVWALWMDGELVLRLTLPRGGDDEMPDMPMTAYTLVHGVPHATRFTQRGAGSQVVFGGDGVALELGEHPVSKELASLHPEAVVLSTWTERMEATFEEPRAL